MIVHWFIHCCSFFSTVATAFLVKLHEISVEAYVPHAIFVPFVGLTSLRTDAGLVQTNTSSNPNDNPPQSILLNVCGRLLLLQQERDGLSLVSQQKSKKNTVQSVTFLPPVMIAAHVESIWTISRRNSTNPYFSNALWLCCGLHGMKVWLPLYRKLDEPRFQSHRIMLTFNLTIYPLGKEKTNRTQNVSIFLRFQLWWLKKRSFSVPCPN